MNSGKIEDKRPLLVCVGGLGGGHQASYMKNTMQKANEAGYQAVFVLFRGTGDMPVQSDKMYCMTSWRDIKEPVDYLHEKYCRKQGRRMYLYAVSLGAAISSNYLLNDDASTPFSGAVTYGCPMNAT